MHFPTRQAVATSAYCCRLSAAWTVSCGLALSALAQDGTPRGDEELLLSYRRSATNDDAGPAENPPGAGAASTPPSADNPLRPASPPTNGPTSEPGNEAAPIYRFAGLNQPPATTPPANPAAEPPGVPIEAAPETPIAPQPAPNSLSPESAETLPRYYDNSVQPLAHTEPASPAEHEPKVAPVETPQLPGAPLPLATERDYAPSTPPASDASRQLAPRSTSAGDGAAAFDAAASNDQGPIKSRLPISFSKLESLSTAGAGLAIVVGLFFICMWLLRRSSGAKHSGGLPNEAFAVLGRAPLTPQSFAQLLRVGNKLVLVAVSADGIQPLTEVIDPLEVDRLTAVCSSGKSHGPAAEFQQVLAQLAREPARGFLGAEATNGGGRRRA